MGEQKKHLARVRSQIATAIIDFVAFHPTFRAEELRAYVAQVTGLTAPGSADRVLRDLRQSGDINYRVVSRRGSLYEVCS